ncbi:MAG: PRC-barrel domain-containing protein [Opitutaceae bacterium]|nr:PRC-barrel domain-containing protein [Opitutaceae bacterium]
MITSRAKFLTRASLACLLFLPALAAQPATTSTRSDRDSTDRPDADHRLRTKHTGATLKASDLIGMKIENAQGDKIGEVEELAVDLRSGSVVQLIVSSGSILSGGERHVAVPPGQIRYGDKNQSLRFDITPERLKAAPAFAMSQWSEFYESDRVNQSDRYFGSETAGDRRAATNSRTEAGRVHKATKIMGSAVRNLQDEKIGSVDDLVIDLPAGRVVAVVVSSGGFLGLGDTMSAVPPTAFRLDGAPGRLQLDTTKDALRNAPRFQAGQWPDFGDADYTAGVYRAYNQEPYASGQRNKPAAADNTARNARDRNRDTLTPTDQGSSAEDVAITQQIRKAVTSTDGFSVTARNVKIITVNGRVTLRGPVKTAEEKSQIAALAARVVGADNVDDQLEVVAR